MLAVVLQAVGDVPSPKSQRYSSAARPPVAAAVKDVVPLIGAGGTALITLVMAIYTIWISVA